MKKLQKFTFIDLFPGIGGIRFALESAGAKCVLSCEIDKYAQKTYCLIPSAMIKVKNFIIYNKFTMQTLRKDDRKSAASISFYPSCHRAHRSTPVVSSS